MRVSLRLRNAMCPVRLRVCVSVMIIVVRICAGFRGLYKGLTATVLKQGSNQAIRFFVHNNITEWMRGGDPKKKISPLQTAISGAIAGAASVLGNTPLDVVKTRMQVRSLEVVRAESSQIVRT
jgi:hypothetical protein